MRFSVSSFNEFSSRIGYSFLVLLLWWGFEILSLLLFPIYKLGRESTHPENMWHRFWQGERAWWDSKQNRVAVRMGSIKKVVWNISQNSQEIFRAGVSFLVKLHAAYLQPNEFCETCKNIPEHYRATASEYSSINSSDGGIGKQICNGCKL